MSKPDAKVSAKTSSLSVESTRNSTPMEPNMGREVKAQIDAELRRVEKLPPTELASLLAPLLEPIIQAAEVMKLLQQRWAAWIEENREWLTQVRGALHEAGAKVGGFVAGVSQASAQFAETLHEVERLASIGWTLPTQLSLPDLIEFLALSDAESAADYLIRKLEVSDPEFVHMEERLRRDPLLREFPTALSQCFRAIRRGDYAIAVPSLVAMLERVIQQLNPPEYHADTNVLKTLRENGIIARKAREDLFCAAVWLSLFKVVEGLWKQFPLAASSTPVLSRPGIQHGRVEPPNSKSEVVRLLNTLETALALHELLDAAASLSSSENLNGRETMRPLWALLHAGLFLPRGRQDRHETDSATGHKVEAT
jgi:hypothetical protein